METFSHCSDLYSDKSKFEPIFVKANDLALLKDVDSACEKILQSEKTRRERGGVQREAKIDLLVMSQGQVRFGPRHETPEGLDRTMSLLYYSRILFIQNLLPLLAPSVSASHTHVISVYAAGLEGKLIPDDLSLRSPKNYGFHQARSHVVHMKTMAFEHLARQHQGLSLVHVYPGLVITPAFYASTMPWWFRLMWAIVGPALSRWCALPAAESAARTIYLANNRRFPPAGDGAETRKLGDEVALGTDGDRGSGAYAVADNSGALDVNAKYEELRKKGFGDEVWEHTMQAFEEIRAGKVFTA